MGCSHQRRSLITGNSEDARRRYVLCFDCEQIIGRKMAETEALCPNCYKMKSKPYDWVDFPITLQAGHLFARILCSQCKHTYVVRWFIPWDENEPNYECFTEQEWEEIKAENDWSDEDVRPNAEVTIRDE